MCQRIFYGDYLTDDVPAEVVVVALEEESLKDPTTTAVACALTLERGVRPRSPSTPSSGFDQECHATPGHGHRVVAPLDSDSTTNFINADLLRRLQFNRPYRSIALD